VHGSLTTNNTFQSKHIGGLCWHAHTDALSAAWLDQIRVGGPNESGPADGHGRRHGPTTVGRWTGQAPVVGRRGGVICAVPRGRQSQFGRHIKRQQQQQQQQQQLEIKAADKQCFTEEQMPAAGATERRWIITGDHQRRRKTVVHARKFPYCSIDRVRYAHLDAIA